VHSAFLGIGGNLGDRLGFLTEAVRRLHQPPRMRVDAVSSVYESKPLGAATQPDYLNAVLRVATLHSPHELMAECLRIETALGRVRRERWGPRTIDIDILLYDDATIADAALTLPHPQMRARNFVLIPLAEIAPDLVLGGASIQTFAGRIDSAGLRKLGRLEWEQPQGGSVDR
jgi:2-amino-4-hydroxy-6-hydroxymethyldihydropteridine diphosphokinase